MLNMNEYSTLNTKLNKKEVLYINTITKKDKSIDLLVDGKVIHETHPVKNTYIQIGGERYLFHTDDDKLYHLYRYLTTIENTLEYDNNSEDINNILVCFPHISSNNEAIPLSYLKTVIVLLHYALLQDWIENTEVDTLLMKTMKEVNN